MSNIKNKAHLWVVLRHDFSGQDIVVASCLTAEKADELVGEYEQQFSDLGIPKEQSYFYTTLTIFYDA